MFNFNVMSDTRFLMYSLVCVEIRSTEPLVMARTRPDVFEHETVKGFARSFVLSVSRTVIFFNDVSASYSWSVRPSVVHCESGIMPREGGAGGRKSIEWSQNDGMCHYRLML